VEMLDRLAEGMRAYWQAAVADDWPRLRAVVEGEVLDRARAMALSGSAAVLAELHPRLRWRQPVMELHKDADFDLRYEGRPLILVPLALAAGVLVAAPPREDVVGIGYQARGIAALWAPDAAGDERLELLVGHGRASVLRALDRPATTTALARRLSYAPSTVSAHLDVLARAGLVERHRVRRSVFYALNDTGRSLVTLLVDAPAALSA
jgi:DNA-binding transcriptional ArsR family regulator